MKSATTVGEPRIVLSLAAVIEHFRAGESSEAYSVLLERPCLAVDLSEVRGVSGSDLDLLRLGLGQLATPSFGLLGEAAVGPVQDIAGCFDALARNEEDLALLVESCRSRPLAALALVQLLRQGGELSVHQGLVAESWVYSMLQSGPEFAAWMKERGVRDAGRGVSAEPAVKAHRDGARLQVTLNRPGKRNAFSAAMRDGLCEALTIARSDPSISEIVMTGAGESFCAGGDLDEFGSFSDPATAHAVRSTRNAARLMSSVAERVRVEVHGACVGAGIELPAFAARVVAHPAAFFQLPEIGMGLIPGAGGTVSLPRRIGRQRTAWLALTGSRLDAPTALAWNLIDEVCDSAPTRTQA